MQRATRDLAQTFLPVLRTMPRDLSLTLSREQLCWARYNEPKVLNTVEVLARPIGKWWMRSTLPFMWLPSSVVPAQS